MGCHADLRCRADLGFHTDLECLAPQTWGVSQTRDVTQTRGVMQTRDVTQTRAVMQTRGVTQIRVLHGELIKYCKTVFPNLSLPSTHSYLPLLFDVDTIIELVMDEAFILLIHLQPEDVSVPCATQGLLEVITP